ncbi:MAG: diguanylate cyclase (GGDEF)-like protein [Gammaproteobacteria bacterium]
MDLDFFKFVNDTHGHSVGDELLAEVANRLSACVRCGDLVARLGGDEFAIVLDDISSVANACVAAENVLDALKKPCEIAGQKIHAHASIGVALYCSGFGSAAKLINAADTAMYETKNNGRNGYRIFSSPMQQANDAAANLERALAEDVATNKISIHFQPQIDIRSGMVSGIEALARWHRQSPADFIPVAERSGLIVRLGDQILRRSCIHFGHWRRQALVSPAARLAVNISAGQLKGNHLVRSVQNALRDSSLPADSLELELTETAVMDDPDNALAVLSELHDLGVRIVLDDFGTGYSSLVHLKRLPICALKIDRSFVNDIGIDGQSETIIRAIVGLANNLGLDMVGEGVETEAQAEFLLSCGCQNMQGWLYSRAISPEELMARLDKGVLVDARYYQSTSPVESVQNLSLTA